MSGRPTDIALRPATPADDAFFGAVYADTRREELDPVPWADDQKAAFLASQFAAQSAHYAQHYEGATHDVVLVDGVPAGRLIVVRTEREVRIVDIALLRGHRGCGVGTRVLQPILDDADTTGRVVSIHVEHLNPAMSLYRRLGFVAAGDAGVYVRMERPPRGSGEDRVTRRHLLQSGAAVGATLALAGTRGAPPARAQAVQEPLRRSTYAGRIGSAFTTRTAEGATVALVLTEVTDLVRARHDATLTGSEDAFALAFEGPPDALVPQGIHTLAHAQLDAVDVFIVPVGRAGESQRYELVVDRSVPAATASRVAPQPLERSTAAADARDRTGPATPPPEAPAPRQGPGPAPASAGRRAGRVRRATVARRGGVLAADVVLDPARRLGAVRVTLRRGDVTYASASRRLHGRASLRLVLRAQRRVPAGEYTLTVTTVDRAGRRATTRVRAWLHR